MTLSATFNQLDEWLDIVTAERDSLLDRLNVNLPHVDCEVSATASEDVLAVGTGTDILHLVGVRNQTHGFVRVAIEWQLDQADNFLGGLVKQVLLTLAKSVLIQQFQFRDLATVGRSQAGATRRLGCGVPQLHLVLIVGRQEKAFFTVQVAWVPDAGRRLGFHFEAEHVFDWEAGIHGSVCDIVLEAAAILAD